MHSVTRSATPPAASRRSRTAYAITRAAQELTDAHGLDGFTMDDLAVAAGVSRRTLFNYYDGKTDAVLGLWPEPDDAVLAEFAGGGPAGDLVEDLRTLVLAMLEGEVSERRTLDRGRRILRDNPRLLAAVHDKYVVLSGHVVELIAHREGPGFGSARARIAVNILASILDTALDEYLADADDRPISHHLDEALRTARSLLGA